MIDIAGFSRSQPISRMLLSLYLVASLAQAAGAQTYTPLFKSVDVQATISPLGKMVEGDFFGRRCIAAISKSEKAIYFFEPDSLENLILTNVVSLPDTPIAISKGNEVSIDSSGGMGRLSKLAVLMKPHFAALVSFGSDGQPELSQLSTVDSYCTGIRAVDLETSGKLDLIGYGRFSLGISIEQNQGGGRFSAVQPTPGPLGNLPFGELAFTDFNGDLVPDMAALDWVNRRLMIYYGRGDGTFAQPVSFQLPAEPSTLSVGDLSGNGYPDIVVGYKRLPQIDIFAGDGFGRFFLRQTIKTAAPVSKFAIADFTGDGTMDIAALSESAGQIVLFAYDPLLRKFRYAGVMGSGAGYDDILPFYFRNRLKADLVASSPTERYVKVFKSNETFDRSPEELLPVSSGTQTIAVAGVDTANYIVSADTAGRITARFLAGAEPGSIREAVDWMAGVKSISMRMYSGADPELLASGKNGGTISLYHLDGGTMAVNAASAETPSPPIAVAGEVGGDTTLIAAAYRMDQDKSVAFSLFTKLKGSDEFLEHDYPVADTGRYVSAAVSIYPVPAFLRISRRTADSLELVCTTLRSDGTSSMILHAQDARLIEPAGGDFPVLSLQNNDSLFLFLVKPGMISGYILSPLCDSPFDSADFGSLKVTESDSIYYLTYVSRSSKSVFLYALSAGQLRFVRAWRVNSEPADVALSAVMRRIYFLYSDEAYVAIHDF